MTECKNAAGGQKARTTHLQMVNILSRAKRAGQKICTLRLSITGHR